MTSKTIYRLLLLAASLGLLAIVWAGRITIEFFALCANSDRRRLRDARERRYSHDYEGYTCEGRPDEIK